MKRNGLLLIPNLHDEDICLSKLVTKIIRHHDQDEREQDGSYHWDTVRSVLLKAFAQRGAGEFSDNQWIHLIHEGSSKKRVEYFLDNKKSSCYLQSNPWTPWWYSDMTGNDGTHFLMTGSKTFTGDLQGCSI